MPTSAERQRDRDVLAVTPSRQLSTTTEFLWRFLSGCLAAIGIGAAGLSYAWYYWYIRRQPGDWCGENGHGYTPYNRATRWPLGAECGNGPLNTPGVPDPYFVPAWGPTFILLAGLAMIVIAIVIFALTGARRRRAPVA